MRSQIKRRIVHRAKETIANFNKELESTEHAIAMKGTDFSIPPMFATKNIRI